jgi:hypothetical protein
MKPKQIELAHLATKLFPYVDRNDGVRDSVKLALEIWEESGNALNPKPALEVEPTHMKLEDFLRSVMPNNNSAKRAKVMRDFQKWFIRGGLDPTGEVEVMETNEIFATERKKVNATDTIVTRLAETRMKTLRENGVHDAPEMRSLFKKWRSLRPKTPPNKTEVPTEVVKPQKKPKNP